MTGDLDAATWRSLLRDADESTVDAVADVLADEHAQSYADAVDTVAAAITDPATPVTSAGDEIVLEEPDETDTSTGLNQQDGPDDRGVLVKDETDDDVAAPSGREFYPDGLVTREWWINWVRAHPLDDDGHVLWDEKPTKQPVAPYEYGHARPVAWSFDLPDDEHPCTSIDRVEPWSDMSTTLDLTAPDRVISDVTGTGIILPRGQVADADDDDRPILLIDWDDVRDPETGEIHPVVARALDECDGYAEISQSGEGIHQFVYGEIPGSSRTFIRHIDTEPFVGDDLPAVEIYQSGRVCAMTGQHVAGTGDDVAEGQDMVDRLCWEFGAADNAGPGTPTDPYADERDGDAATDDGDDRSDAGSIDVPDHDAVGQALDEMAAFDDVDPDEWEYPDEWSLRYAAVVRARGRGDDLTGIANWQLNGYAAAVGYHDGREREDVVADLNAVCDDDALEKEVGQVWRKADAGDYKPPSRSRLAQRGLLPDRFDRADGDGDDGPATQLVALPDVDDPDERTDDTDGDTDTDAANAGDDLDVGDEPPVGALTVDHARRRTRETLTDAYTGDRDVLVEALPSMGKSYGAVAAAVDTGKPATILVGRGNNEQYDRVREWCREQGLDVGDRREPDGDVYILPSFKRDCETANGDHGDEWADTVDGWYQAGATPKQIHKLGPYTLPEDVDALPCQRDGDCGYARSWDFDPDDFAVLIGHYTHAHKPKVTTDRVVVVDEFTTAYETVLAGDQLRGAITQYLDTHGVAARDEFVDDRDGGYLPYQSFADLLLARDDVDRRAPAVEWLRNRGIDPDEHGAIYFDDGDGTDGDGDESGTAKHAAAPLAIYTILKSYGGALGNGYERVDFRPDIDEDRRVGVFNPHGKDRQDDDPAVSILRPPAALRFADVVVGLDGTPTPEMWELICGRSFDHRVVLEGGRAEYIETALNFRIIPTTDAIKPYNYHDHIHDDHDGALLDAITAHHDERPAVISTSTALRSWDDADVFDDVDLGTDDPYERVTGGPAVGALYHGDVLGSNAFADERVGAVIGSNHYGDGFVKRWGAYANESVSRQHADPDTADPDTKPRGSDLTYGAFGDKIRRHMTAHDTLQAIMRFGRDAGGATVYVDTDTLPDWVPTHGRGDVRGVSDGLVGVLDALEDVGPASTAALVEHDAVDVTRRQVRRHLETLADVGVVSDAPDPDDGRRTIYGLDDTAPITTTGVVDLPDVTDPPERTPTDAEDDGESSGRVPYSRNIYVRRPEDWDTPDAVADGRVRPVAIPDGGVVAAEVTWEDAPDLVDTDEELTEGDLDGVDRVALGGIRATGIDVEVKTRDEDGDVWYVRRDGTTGDVLAHRRGGRPATRRRRRPATTGARGDRRGSRPTRGPASARETHDGDTLEDT